MTITCFEYLFCYSVAKQILDFLPWRNSPSGPRPTIHHHTHLDTQHSVGFLRTIYHPQTESSTCQHTTITKHKHPCPWRDSNPQSQQTSGRRPTGIGQNLELIIKIYILRHIPPGKIQNIFNLSTHWSTLLDTHKEEQFNSLCNIHRLLSLKEAYCVWGMNWFFTCNT
jgi:hypothetical protein